MTEVKIMRINLVTADSKRYIEMNLNDLTFKSNVFNGKSGIVLDPPHETSYTWTIKFDILDLYVTLTIICNGKQILTKTTPRISVIETWSLELNSGRRLTILFDTADTISTHYRPLPSQENLQLINIILLK